VQGNYRITDAGADSDVRHIVLDLGSSALPVLEGQSLGVVPPGEDAQGRKHHVRLYSVCSPRDGERPNHNNIALTVKRVVEQRDDGVFRGVASNYLCDLKRGDRVELTGPYGSTFLMPDNADANIVMICTGTGSAPFRAMTERRRRSAPGASGRLLLFFGARTPGELPYFGPLMKLPDSLIHRELVFSRLPGQAKEYVQDRIRRCSDEVAGLLASGRTHLYVCGLKGMEDGVEAALKEVCAAHDLDWGTLRDVMRVEGRYHVETY
jgi:benzoyl-CoA 2,3-dioxygenase component A